RPDASDRTPAVFHQHHLTLHFPLRCASHAVDSTGHGRCRVYSLHGTAALGTAVVLPKRPPPMRRLVTRHSALGTRLFLALFLAACSRDSTEVKGTGTLEVV